MIAYLIALGILTGFTLAVLGSRGRRIDDHPLCRQCRYDLHGLQRPLENCPECGRDLRRRRAICIGHRHRRRLLLTVGALLLLASLGVGSLLGWRAISEFNFNPYKPVWLLKSHALSVKTQRAAGAQQELLARLADRRLAHDDVVTIVDESLVVQRDQNAPWHTWRGDFIEQAWLAGEIPDEVVLTYLKTGVVDACSLRLPAQAQPGGTMRVRVVKNTMRAGTQATFGFYLNWAPLKREDGVILWESGGWLSGLVWAGPGTASLPIEKDVYWASRRYHVTCEATMRVGRRMQRNGVRQSDFDDSWAMASWPITLETDFEILPRKSK